MDRVWTDRLDFSEMRTKAEVASGYTRFAEGDLLLPKITPTFEAGRAAIVAGLPDGVGAGTTELHVLRPRQGVNPRWLLHFLNHATFLRRGHYDMYGVAGQKRISETFVKSYPVELPDLDEQGEVAARLDLELRNIDELSGELVRLLGLVVEEAETRQSTFATKGVGGRALTATGVVWLGAIPTHWRVSRLKFEARLESGHTPSRSRPELWEDCIIPWVSLNDVGTLGTTEYINETVNLISKEGLASSSARVLPRDTVVVSRDATIGRCGILAIPMATSQHFANWICGPRLEPRYLWLVFHTVMQQHFNSLTDGATLRTIGMSDMRDLVVSLPPLEEQRAIVDAAERTRAHETAVVNEIDHQLQLLREHRQALITAAVTAGLDALDQVA
jgi:type I restriction enzyme S subunit